jgi:hypothetical protein
MTPPGEPTLATPVYRSVSAIRPGKTMVKFRTYLTGLALVSLTQLVGATASASDAVVIFRSDGTRQCHRDVGRTLAADARLLNRAGVSAVLHSEKKSVPGLSVIAVCGAPTLMANAFVITKKDWERYGDKLRASPLGFAQWP